MLDGMDPVYSSKDILIGSMFMQISVGHVIMIREESNVRRVQQTLFTAAILARNNRVNTSSQGY